MFLWVTITNVSCEKLIWMEFEEPPNLPSSLLVWSTALQLSSQQTVIELFLCSMEAIMRGMSILSCPKCCFLNLHKQCESTPHLLWQFCRTILAKHTQTILPFSIRLYSICQNHLSPVLFAILATYTCYTIWKHLWNLNSHRFACDLVHLNHASITSAIWGKNTDGACLVGPVGASNNWDWDPWNGPTLRMQLITWASRLATMYNFLQQILMIHPQIISN